MFTLIDWQSWNSLQSFRFHNNGIQRSSPGREREKEGRKKVCNFTIHRIHPFYVNVKPESFFFCFSWKVISLRVLANILILLLLMSSAYAVVLVVERSATVTSQDGWWRQNEITLALSLITTIFPNIFELVGMLENYHPRKQLRWQLARFVAWIIKIKKWCKHKIGDKNIRVLGRMGDYFQPQRNF